MLFNDRISQLVLAGKERKKLCTLQSAGCRQCIGKNQSKGGKREEKVTIITDATAYVVVVEGEKWPSKKSFSPQSTSLSGMAWHFSMVDQLLTKVWAQKQPKISF